MQKKSYILALLKIHDKSGFETLYKPRAAAIVKKFGGIFRIADAHPEWMETPGSKAEVVLIEFEGEERARDFYNSAEYQEIIHLRFDSADTALCFAKPF